MRRHNGAHFALSLFVLACTGCTGSPPSSPGSRPDNDRVPMGLQTSTASPTPQRHLIKAYMRPGHTGDDVRAAQACFRDIGVEPELMSDRLPVVQGMTELTTSREQRTQLQLCLHQYGTFAPEG